MTKQPNRRSPFANPSGSADVRRMVDEAQQRQKASQTDGRGRAGNSGQKGVDKRGVKKKTLPLPLETQADIERIAQAENVPQGDIVMAAMQVFAELYDAKKIDLFDFKEIIYSDTQAWRSSTRLIIPDEFRFFAE